VGIVETQMGTAFTGTASEWARFGRGISGDLVGVNQVVEGGFGYDISNQQGLSGMDRVARAAQGTAALAGNAAGLSAAARFAPKAFRTAARAAQLAPRNVLRSGGDLPSTGIGRYDELVVGTEQYAKWARNMQGRGFVIDDAARLAEGTAGYIEGNRIVIDPRQFRYVDLLHETRHAGQVERAAAQGVTSRSKLVRAWFEKGAYNYELRLGSRVGFYEAYMNWVRSRIGDYVTPGISKQIIRNPHIQSGVRLQDLWK
jgi:hypothetical protein